jgi:hypothetical protein
MLRHGFAEEYKILAQRVSDKKMLSMEEWVFHFDYLQVARYIVAMPNTRLVFRNFHTLCDNSIGADFISLLPIVPAPDGELLDLRSNERDAPSVSLSLFLSNRVRRPLQSAEIEVIDHLCRDNIRHVKTGEALRGALVNAFRKRNRLFCRKYKVPPRPKISVFRMRRDELPVRPGQIPRKRRKSGWFRRSKAQS